MNTGHLPIVGSAISERLDLVLLADAPAQLLEPLEILVFCAAAIAAAAKHSFHGLVIDMAPAAAFGPVPALLGAGAD